MKLPLLLNCERIHSEAFNWVRARQQLSCQQGCEHLRDHRCQQPSDLYAGSVGTSAILGETRYGNVPRRNAWREVNQGLRNKYGKIDMGLVS
jgi:hypothetical protein